VERRQASAPASGGRRKPLSSRGASRTPLACGQQDHASAGVPLLIFCRSFFVIAGLDPAIHAEGKLDRICR
jgi:hypothetical protein